MILFQLNPTAGQPLYMQVMQQIRHAVETGVLRHGDLLPGIRTLAEELVVSPSTIVKAYSELEHQGLLEIRQGAGAFVCVNRRTRLLADKVQSARSSLHGVIEELRDIGLQDEEIQRAFEMEMMTPVTTARKR